MANSKITNKKLFEAIVSYIQGYLSISTFHGVNHIASSRHLIEKIFWIVLVTLSLYYGWSLSIVTLNRYLTNPIVISLERDKFSWTTSLPAATVCPVSNIHQKSLQEFVEKSNSSNTTNLPNFLTYLFYANYTNFDKVIDNWEISPEEYISIIMKLHKPVNPEITFSGQNLDSKSWVVQTITEMGICYSFNSQLAVYNSPKIWKEDNWNILSQRQTFELHPLDGEAFVNIVNISSGFNVYVHGPYEVADIRRRPIFVADSTFEQVFFTALTIISSEATQNLGISQRKCRFYYESNLEHSPVYSYVLCQTECRINLAKKLCGCIPHFYRKRPGDEICNIRGLHCLAQYKEKLIYLENLENECRCEANCEEVNYVVEETDNREWFLGSNFQYGIKNFPDMRFKRDVIFGFSDLLVYIGGVIGLFVGASVLTFIEFFYYFTLRLFWYIRNG